MSAALVWIGERAIWFAVGLAVWVAVAVFVGIPVGRIIRGRDRQTPRD